MRGAAGCRTVAAAILLFRRADVASVPAKKRSCFYTMDTFPLLTRLNTTSMMIAEIVRIVAIAAAVPKLFRATSL
jgi:hypothetical protein